MGAGLGRDLDAAGLAPGDDVHGQGAGDVGDVHGQVQIFGQHDVAGGLHGLAHRGLALDAQAAAEGTFVHDPAAGQGAVLAVIDEGQAQVGAVFHDAAQQFGAGHGTAVIGDGHATGVLELLQGGHLFTGQAHGGGGDGAEARTVGMGLGGAVQHETGDAGVVVDGLGVGHAHDRTETAAGGGFQAGIDVFLVFEAGLAQVDVGVHHAGHEDQAAGVHDLAAFGRGVVAGGGHGHDLAVPHQQVNGGVQFLMHRVI